MTRPRPGAFEVLVVCTGNICRSPAAQSYLTDALGTDGLRVASAGLRALAGEPIAAEMVAVMRIEPPASRAQQLSPQLVAQADLVLTMTRDQRRDVVTMVPAAVRRTFTLAEFAGLAQIAARQGDLPPEGPATGRLADLVAAVPRLRALRAPGEDDIEDPHGRDEQVFAAVDARIRAAVAAVAAVVDAAPGRPTRAGEARPEDGAEPAPSPSVAGHSDARGRSTCQ